MQDSSLVLGSASAICASAAATLGNQVAFFGKVGCDVWGDFSLQRMQSAGIDTSRVIRDPKLKTGITVSISGAADRALVTHLGFQFAIENFGSGRDSHNLPCTTWPRTS